MQVNPGELNRKISIYSPPTARDTDGFPTGAPTLIHSCNAKFSRTSGTETIKSNSSFEDIKVRFLIRYTLTHINREMTVKYAGEDYEIEYINDYEDCHQYVEIWCSKITSK